MGAISDPIADALNKVQNASRAGHATVEVHASRMIERVLGVLKQEGFIRSYKAIGETPATRSIKVYLKYAGKKIPAISQVVRVSKPGQREYRPAAELPRVLRGLGLAVVSTSKGVMSEKDAYRQKIGGEVLCYVW